MTIIFSKNGPPVSDYDIETFYQDNKNKEIINISNLAVLDRFRLGIKEKEIPIFILKVYDKDKKDPVYEHVNEIGKFLNVWKLGTFQIRKRILNRLGESL